MDIVFVAISINLHSHFLTLPELVFDSLSQKSELHKVYKTLGKQSHSIQLESVPLPSSSLCRRLILCRFSS